MISLENLTWAAGDFRLCLDLRLQAPITGIFGPSGSGKTTLIELIAGLRRPSSGRITVAGHVVCDTAAPLFVAPERRGVGYVPQDAALFPHLSVEENLRYGAGRRTLTTPLPAALDELCELLGIQGLRGHAVPGLSGGERQRVALARALVSQPRLLLLDEPFANLDGSRKDTILPYLSRLHEHTGTPLLFVSHSADDMASLSDEVVVLAKGCALAHGTAQELFETHRADIRRLKSGLL